MFMFWLYLPSSNFSIQPAQVSGSNSPSSDAMPTVEPSVLSCSLSSSSMYGFSSAENSSFAKQYLTSRPIAFTEF